MPGFKLFLLLLLITQPMELLAHGGLKPERGTRINASVSASAYLAPINEGTWLIPGSLMGGEAYGKENGFALDEASVTLSYGSEYNTLFIAELSSHSHHDDYSLSFEQAFLGQYWRHQDHDIRLDAGQLKAQFSPLNSQHLSEQTFNDQTLNHLIFMGGHYSDLGVRATINNHNMTLGAEAWQGGTFPGKKTDGLNAYDIFAYYRMNEDARKSWQLKLGLWHFSSQSTNRQDERFKSGHSHGSNNELIAGIRYTGKQALTGTYAMLDWEWMDGVKLVSTSELVWNQGDGRLRDQTRLAQYDFRHLGALQQLEIDFGRHRFGLRYDWLALKNTLTGPGSQGLAVDANLLNGKDPYRVSLAHNYIASDGLKIKTGLTLDETSTQSQHGIWFSVTWDGAYSP